MVNIFAVPWQHSSNEHLEFGQSSSNRRIFTDDGQSGGAGLKSASRKLPLCHISRKGTATLWPPSGSRVLAKPQ